MPTIDKWAPAKQELEMLVRAILDRTACLRAEPPKREDVRRVWDSWLEQQRVIYAGALERAEHKDVRRSFEKAAVDLIGCGHDPLYVEQMCVLARINLDVLELQERGYVVAQASLQRSGENWHYDGTWRSACPPPGVSGARWRELRAEWERREKELDSQYENWIEMDGVLGSHEQAPVRAG